MRANKQGERGGANSRSPSGARTRPLALSKAERETLREACRRYRNAIPCYLESQPEEIATLDRLLRKLS